MSDHRGLIVSDLPAGTCVNCRSYFPGRGPGGLHCWQTHTRIADPAKRPADCPHGQGVVIGGRETEGEVPGK